MAVVELSNEDSLRLNVLVMNVEAVRIDERGMAVYGLSTRGEAKVQLNPTGRSDQYLRAVREFLSSYALGSPGGYPVHLNRWTRMGQARDANLAKLLMLGEPEAIAAVVCAPGLTEEIARRAWWVDPSSENARRMLACAVVVQGELGRVLAGHLIEHLPFESEPHIIIDTVRLILQPGLIESEVRQRLWEKGSTQSAYRIGFLEAEPDSLPQPVPARTDRELLRATLTRFASDDNPLAALLLQILDSPGQSFFATCEQVLNKLSSQDAVVALLNVLSRYFVALRKPGEPIQDVAVILEEVALVLDTEPVASKLLAVLPELRPELLAMYTLAHLDEAVVTPVFARSSASGTLMRRKIEPVIRTVLAQITALRRNTHG
jgi:hypothetical protein